MSKILILDDDTALADSVEEVLSAHGHIVDKAEEASFAEEMLKSAPYDLLILDWNMPDVTGIEFLRRIRVAGMQLPVLMLTGMDTIDSKECGLDAGADDYLTKPFNSRELAARVRAILRRPQNVVDNAFLDLNGVKINTKTFQVRCADQEVKLTKQEYQLLEFLMRNKDQPFSSEQLVERAWSTLTESSPDTVRVHMFRLRKKLEVGGNDCPIRTFHGQGYVFVSNPTAKMSE